MKYTPEYSSRFRILKGGKISLVVSAFLAGTTLTHASPTGGTVTTGSASISQIATTTTINQSSQKASINWQSFSIAPNETVNFVQPSASAITLNRVIGATPSLIEGAMNANGQVFLINPNGVVFAQGSQVNVGGIVASTLNLTDDNFQAGNYVFEGNSQNAVLNMGTITAAQGGYVAMMGKSVANEGTIVATMGNAQLASGEKMSLNLNGNSLLGLTIDQGTLNALVENGGLIKADGGQVYLTTQAINTILDGMVNNTGIIEAQSLNNVDGKIVLFAHGGTGEFGGTLGTGKGTGFIETSGKEFVNKSDLKVETGHWLIDPLDITIDQTLANAIGIALNTGDVTISTQGSNTPNTASYEVNGLGDITLASGVIIATGEDADDDYTLTLRADNSIYFEEGSKITALDSYEGLNVYLSAKNTWAGDSGEIILRNTTIETRGGDIIIGGMIDENTDTPTIEHATTNKVNVQILGSTLNASYSVTDNDPEDADWFGDISVGGEQVIIGESVTGGNHDLDNRTTIVGKDITIVSKVPSGDMDTSGINIDATDITVGNSLNLKAITGRIDFSGDDYPRITESLYGQYKSSIEFVGGNILNLQSASNIQFVWFEDKGEGYKPSAIDLTFSDAATVDIKTMQEYTTNDVTADVLRDVFGTSTMWDGSMFMTAGHYDLHGGTVATQIFSDGSTVNGWATAAGTPMLFENDYLAFGNGFNDAINQYGMLRSPFYKDENGDWKQLTFGNLPMSVVIGVGEYNDEGMNEWNLDGQIVSSLESSEDFSPFAFGNRFIDVSGMNGNSGTLEVAVNMQMGDDMYRLTNTYYLPSDAKYIRTDTKLANLNEERGAENVRLWVGVQDDYIAGWDWAIDRTRGNLVGGSGFVATDEANFATERSHAILFGTIDTGVLFHTTSDTGAGFITTYDWGNDDGYYSDLYDSGKYNATNPVDSINTLADDGMDAGYGIFNRYADLAAGESATTRWYYGAGAIDDIATLADAVSEDIANSVVVPPSGGESGGSTEQAQQEQTVKDVVTTIVNQTTVTAPSTPIFTIPSVPNTAGQQASQTLVSAIFPGQDLGLVSSPDGKQPVRAMESNELMALAASNGMSDLRVPLGNDSMVDLVNGGLNLPAGVNQEFYVVSNSDSTQRSGNNKTDKDDKNFKKN